MKVRRILRRRRPYLAAAASFRPLLLLFSIAATTNTASSLLSSPSFLEFIVSPSIRPSRDVVPRPPSIVAATAAAVSFRPPSSVVVVAARELRASSMSSSDSDGGAAEAEGTAPPPPSASSSSIDVATKKVKLSTGTDMEIKVCVPTTVETTNDETKKKPPLIFVHGSFHSGWCWTERYFPYFVARGYPCVALSLAGTGGTYAGDGVAKVKIDRHADDLSALLDRVALDEDERGLGLPGKPALIAHSFGGLTAMKYLERPTSTSRISGVALLCSVPPGGIKGLIVRSLLRSPLDAYRITRGLAMKKALTDAKLCRRLFFGEDDDGNGVSEEDLDRYRSNFRRDTIATIDLSDLNKRLPSKFAGEDDGIASYVERLSSKPLVMGGTKDFIVDPEGVEETAKFFGTEAVMVDGAPHDVMLTGRWEEGAKVLSTWLESDVLRSTSRGGGTQTKQTK